MSSVVMEITGSSLETESREAPCDPAILHLCEHSIDFGHAKGIYTSMFTAAIFIISQVWSPVIGQSMNKWMRKMPQGWGGRARGRGRE